MLQLLTYSPLRANSILFIAVALDDDWVTLNDALTSNDSEWRTIRRPFALPE